MYLQAAQDTAAAVKQALATAHQGELAGEAMGAISVLAGMLGRMLLPFVPFAAEDDKRQRLMVITVSAIALALYCREAEVAIIGHGFTIVTSFCVVALATLGTFNLSDPKNYTKANLSAMTNAATLGLAGTKAPQPPKD